MRKEYSSSFLSKSFSFINLVCSSIVVLIWVVDGFILTTLGEKALKAAPTGAKGPTNPAPDAAKVISSVISLLIVSLISPSTWFKVVKLSFSSLKTSIWTLSTSSRKSFNLSPNTRLWFSLLWQFG